MYTEYKVSLLLPSFAVHLCGSLQCLLGYPKVRDFLSVFISDCFVLYNTLPFAPKSRGMEWETQGQDIVFLHTTIFVSVSFPDLTFYITLAETKLTASAAIKGNTSTSSPRARTCHFNWIIADCCRSLLHTEPVNKLCSFNHTGKQSGWCNEHINYPASIVINISCFPDFSLLCANPKHHLFSSVWCTLFPWK